MCGIVGYIGEKSAADILIDGLKQLEYRGYDSSGVALMEKDKIDIYKAEGKLQNLNDLLFINRDKIISSTLGIGHIRWATHGAATVVNAHPHTCNCGGISLKTLKN